MAIVQELNKSWFIDRFNEMGRSDNFSYEALETLYDYYEEYSQQTGEDYHLDVIAICCDWSEDSYADIINNYGLDIDDCEDEEDVDTVVEEYLEENTTYFKVGDKLLYQSF